MYIIYCIFTSIVTTYICETNSLDGDLFPPYITSFLIIFAITILISNPHKKYKRNIMIFTTIITLLAICNILKINFQVAEVTVFDFSLIKPAIGFAPIFFKQIPYKKIAFILIIYILLFFISYNYDIFYKKIAKIQKNILDSNITIITSKILSLVIILTFIFNTAFVLRHFKMSSLGNFILSCKLFTISQTYAIRDPQNVINSFENKVKQNELSSVDKDDPLLKPYPFSKQENLDIVAIQSEAFFDIKKYQNLLEKNGIVIHYDITKHFQNYQNQGISGKLYTPVLGAGTCNTEYEFLTGYGAKYFSKYMIIFTSILKKDTNSIIRYYKELFKNPYATAIHTYKKEFWDRDRVYPLLGFDNYISRDMFSQYQQEDLLGLYMSDRTILNMAEKVLESKKDKNNFVFLVTMQNHVPFQFKGKKVKVDNLTKEDEDKISGYITKIKYSDEYLKDFMDYIDKKEKPTMVIFYGDHKPDAFYDIFKNSSYYNKNQEHMYCTDYFIYFNKAAMKNKQFASLKGVKKDLSAPALGRYVQILLGDKSKLSMYIYNYIKDPKNYFDNEAIAGMKTPLYRDISRELVNLNLPIINEDN